MGRCGFGESVEVALVGLAFKGVPPTGDLRGSMSLRVIDALEKARPELVVRLFDPVVGAADLKAFLPNYKTTECLLEAVDGASVVIIANNHPDLGRTPPQNLRARMAPNGFIYDYWNHFSNLSATVLDSSYFAVGNWS
jgi:UDP-N-acetyl-D-mannosaminuronic acid dehydrogenase